MGPAQTPTGPGSDTQSSKTKQTQTAGWRQGSRPSLRLGQPARPEPAAGWVAGWLVTPTKYVTYLENRVFANTIKLR